MIISPIVAVIIVFLIVLNSVILPASDYKKALEAVEAGRYGEAYSLFNKRPDYKDTDIQIKEAKLKEATEYLEAKDYDEAYSIFEELGDTEKINESMYNRAVEFVNAGDKISAYILFAQISGYKDADKKATEYKPEYIKDLISKAKVGDSIILGTYEQDNDTSNGKEDIEWIVLDKKDGKLLVISKYALDCKPYNTSYTDVTWETCSLRKWMNDTFLKEAFSASEQKQIQSTKVTADANPNYSTDPGKDTTDKIFLLSITEVNKYFSSDDAMICEPTSYAVANNAYVYDSTGGCWWWLRSPGLPSNLAAAVDYYGDVYRGGDYVDSVFDSVRPALWIEI